MNSFSLLGALAAATVVGLAAKHLRIPGGIILGAMIGAAAVTLLTGTEIALPAPLRDAAAFVVIGAAIGVQLTRHAVRSLGPVLVPAVLAALLIIIAGVGVAYLLRVVGLAPPGDVLATSPGALSVMSATALEQNTGAVEVAVFHLVRVVMVLLSLPLLVRLLPQS